MLAFSRKGNESKMKVEHTQAFFLMPWTMISEIKATKDKVNLNYYLFEISLKDLRLMQFKVFDPYKNYHKRITDNLAKYNSFPELYAFKFFKRTDLESKFRGWEIFDLVKEYYRQGLDFEQEEKMEFNMSKGIKWRLVKNQRTTTEPLCDSYPEYLMIPGNINPVNLQIAIKFRSRNRFPVMTYYWHNDELPRGYATLWRCAQCNTGFSSRSTEDEFYLFSLHDPTAAGDITTFTDAKRNSCGVNVHIFDARPKIAAVGNRLSGKGYESSEYYTNCDVSFNRIENAPTMQSAYDKLGKCVVEFDSDNFWTTYAESGWAMHLSRILKMSCAIIKAMYANITPLVHCSDGWDRTSQVCALVQLQIDPYFRTLRGFISLIEKDWSQFGHQFALRNGIAMYNDKQRSPVFVQFLDCIHQIMHQYPTAFEFNQELLKDLAYHTYSGAFGTFLCDNRREREKAQLKERTVSVWSYVLEHEYVYKNPFYVHNPGVLLVNTLPCNMRFWREHLLQHAPTKCIFTELPIGEPTTDYFKKIAQKVCSEGKLKEYV